MSDSDSDSKVETVDEELNEWMRQNDFVFLPPPSILPPFVYSDISIRTPLYMRLILDAYLKNTCNIPEQRMEYLAESLLQYLVESNC